MKVSNQFILRKIADEQLLIPVGEAAVSVRGLIALSESGGLLYEKLRSGCDREALITALTSEYEVDRETAAQDVDAFLDQMRSLQILVED